MKKIISLLMALLLINIAFAITEEAGPEIQNFRLEDNKFVFDTNYIYSDFYIDGESVPASTKQLGGAAHTEYEISCQEGDLLELKYTYPDESLIYVTSFDISSYSCEEPEQEGPELLNFRVENGKFVFDAYYIYSDLYIDGEKVSAEKSPMGGSVHTLYKIPCEEGNLLEAKHINPYSDVLTFTSKDISGYECEMEEEGPEIRNFRIEDNKFKFEVNYIYDNMYIDGSKVSFDKGMIGGAANTWYETECREGNVLELKFTNPVSGMLTYSTKDISHYECIEENEEIDFDYIHLHPNMDSLVLTDSGYNIYADVSLRQMGSSTMKNVIVTMEIPQLGLKETEIIDELKPNYGTPTPGQFSMDIPSSVKSGTYKVKFYANNELLKSFIRNIYREEEVTCSDLDKLNYYNKGKIKLTLKSGEVIKSQKDACCVNCMTAPSEEGPYVSEYYCDGNKIQREIYECPLGCDNGRCEGEIEYVEEEEPIAVPEPDEVEKKIFICGACELDGLCYPIGFRKGQEFCIGKEFADQKDDEAQCSNSYECKSNICERNQCGKYCDGCKDSNKNCYPFGTRIDNKYCNLNKEFAAQKLNEGSCNNNYECVSNLCVNSKCIEPSFLQKILDWFKNLFG